MNIFLFSVRFDFCSFLLICICEDVFSLFVSSSVPVGLASWFLAVHLVLILINSSPHSLSSLGFTQLLSRFLYLPVGSSATCLPGLFMLVLLSPDKELMQLEDRSVLPEEQPRDIGARGNAVLESIWSCFMLYLTKRLVSSIKVKLYLPLNFTIH